MYYDDYEIMTECHPLIGTWVSDINTSLILKKSDFDYKILLTNIHKNSIVDSIDDDNYFNNDSLFTKT